MFRYRFLLLLSVMFLGFAPRGVQGAQNVTVVWDRNTETDVSGYRVIYGTASGQFSQTQDVGPANSATIAGLPEGVTYYVAVTAYNAAGAESSPSNEVSFVVPGGSSHPAPTAAPTIPPTSTPGPTAPPSTPLPTATMPPSTTPNPGPVPTAAPTVAPNPLSSATPTPTPVQASFSNVSTRAYVQTGENVLIGGLIIAGTEPKKVILRAIGPSLLAAGLTNALRDPTMDVYNSKGEVIASNDNWRTNAAAVKQTGLAPSNEMESAIVTTLDPGAYTAVISGAGGTKGIALFELYDLTTTNSRVGNIATRCRVELGEKVMIGGFIVAGSQPSQVVVRALGPSLTQSGVEGALSDPVLELYNSNGSQIFVNDNWRSNQEQQIAATGLAPSDDREAAIAASLQPGNYTAMVRGAGNATGVGLIEVYNLSR